MPCKFQSLAGPWRFLHREHWYPAQVPGCIHTDLLRNGLIPDPFWGANEQRLQWIEEEDWIYRVEFDLQLDDCEHIELVADGLDTVAEVRLNDVLIGQTDNMFIRYRFDVRAAIKPIGNVLEVRFTSPLKIIRERQQPGDAKEWNDPVGGSSHLRKQPSSFGWDWGPRFVTSGIYLPIGLEGWDYNRIDSVRVHQIHEAGEVQLRLRPELMTSKPVNYRGSISLDGTVLERFAGLSVRIRAPRLWWPNRHGDQPIYDLQLEAVAADGRTIDRWEKRIGLRIIELDRHQGALGESFQFRVNGRPIFAKGANWIPAHSFVTEASPEMYKDLIDSAAEVGMNMVRVWGGGIYEKDLFYDLCDEKGLLVWQDFMFACALYPDDKAFLESVRREAIFQVKRLAHHASLALWCGNNELELKPEEIRKTTKRRRAYKRIFYNLLPGIVAAHDGTTAYWPASPHNPAGYVKGPNSERGGDSHLWDVWHLRKPAKHYETQATRFCSEFGMQSYSSPQVAATYCSPDKFSIQAPEMANHQKNAAGDEIIFDYVSKRYPRPTDYAASAYLSQLNQAYCIKVAVEHFRRLAPRTMGALYWQLNDCWPGASWSSIEFGGRWKALHYAASRFFAPALVSAHVPGDEFVDNGEGLRGTIRDVHLYTIFDGPIDRMAKLRWSLASLDGEVIRSDEKEVMLRYGESILQHSLDLQAELARYGPHNLILRVELLDRDELLSQQIAFFTAPKHLHLQQGQIDASFYPKTVGLFDLVLRSDVFHFAVMIDFEGIDYRLSDNFVDLLPGEDQRIEVRTAAALADLQAALRTTSLFEQVRTATF
jgi:beta-mannosidase